MRRATLLVVGLVALALVVSGCGIPIDSSTRTLSAQAFPQPDAPQPTTPTGKHASSQKGFVVYFLHRGVLTAVSRPDPSTTAAVTPAIAIEAINNGPAETELDSGYTSALSAAPGAQVSAGTVSAAGVATVSLNSNFVDFLFTPALYEAYGQIVLTLSAPNFPLIKQVQFLFDGSPIAAYLPSGQIKVAPVVPCDYASIASSAIKKLCANSSTT